MKRVAFALALCFLFLVSCGTTTSPNEEELSEKKKVRIEVYSAQGEECLKTITDQEDAATLLEIGEQEIVEAPLGDLTPEYELRVYQEKTLLMGQDPEAEREYELIETLTTFCDSNYVASYISGNVVHSGNIPEDLMTFYYELSDETRQTLYDMIQ